MSAVRSCIYSEMATKRKPALYEIVLSIYYFRAYEKSIINY